MSENIQIIKAQEDAEQLRDNSGKSVVWLKSLIRILRMDHSICVA